MNINIIKYLYAVIGAIIILFIANILYTRNTNDLYLVSQLEVSYLESKNVIQEKEGTIRRMSVLLNQASQKVGQLSCQQSNDDVSVNGGWCSKISGKNSTQHMTDEPLALALSKFMRGKKVASFGDGPGVYKDLLLGYGEVAGYDSFDGAPFVELTTNNNVKFLDLSVPIYHLSQYDWVISLEVAEHIPKASESIYLDNLVRHAKEGIVLSWARVGQTGHSHVNNQNFPYIKSRMEKRDFYFAENASKLLKRAATFDWFKNNINVFKRKLF